MDQAALETMMTGVLAAAGTGGAVVVGVIKAAEKLFGGKPPEVPQPPAPVAELRTLVAIAEKQLERADETVGLLREIHSEGKADRVRHEELRSDVREVKRTLDEHIRDEGAVLTALSGGRGHA